MTIVTVGIGMAKNVFAVHGVDETGQPTMVRPEVPRGKPAKNDAADAAAVAEAVTRPSMRFLPVRSTAQQSRLFVHHARQQLRSTVTSKKTLDYLMLGSCVVRCHETLLTFVQLLGVSSNPGRFSTLLIEGAGLPWVCLRVLDTAVTERKRRVVLPVLVRFIGTMVDYFKEIHDRP